MDTADPLRIGLIGFGNWAREAYVPVLHEQPGVRISAVAARTEATRERAREQFGPDTELYGGYEDLIEASDVDAVMIGLPSSLAAEAAGAAVQAGRHVFVEPPINGASDTGGVLDLAERSDTVFHVDLELRYLPVVDALREMASEGRLGRLLVARVELVNDWFRHRTETEAQKGFDVFGLGTWYIDLLDAIFDQSPERVSVHGSYPRYDNLMELGTAVLEYPDTALGEWQINLSGGGWELRLNLTGTEGQVEADLMSGIYRYRAAGEAWRTVTVDASRPEHGFVGMRESVLAFLAAVRGETPSRSGPETYRRLHGTLAALTRSIDTKDPVRMGSD
jgi:predicted dehydrogenase